MPQAIGPERKARCGAGKEERTRSLPQSLRQSPGLSCLEGRGLPCLRALYVLYGRLSLVLRLHDSSGSCANFRGCLPWTVCQYFRQLFRQIIGQLSCCFFRGQGRAASCAFLSLGFCIFLLTACQGSTAGRSLTVHEPARAADGTALSARRPPRDGAGPAGHERAGADQRGPLGRVDPGYVQWLARHSMAGQVPVLAAQVSASPLLWRHNSSDRRTDLLLRAAPNWLELVPSGLSTAGPLLRDLPQTELLAVAAQAGLGGIFIAPLMENGDIWTRSGVDASGGHVVSLQLAASVGTEEDFFALAQKLEALDMQLGGSLPPAATGLGPDFMLQARKAAGFEGIYAMLPVPPEAWDSLPAQPEAWECLPLRPEAVEALVRRGILPQAVARDSLAWAARSGWAVTGPVRGTDGQSRRWVYRYSGHVLRPVLAWQDPAAQARRILSAAAIQHTGLQGQSLAALHMEALMGLEAAPAGQEAGRTAQALTPAPEALAAVAREVRRYGGWSVQADVLPASLNESVLASAVDFNRDAAVPAAVAYAMLTADVGPLAAFLRQQEGQGIQRRVRGLGDSWCVDWRPLLAVPQGRQKWNAVLRAVAGRHGLGEDARLWPLTPAGLAALAVRSEQVDSVAAGLPEQKKQPEQRRPEQEDKEQEAMQAATGLILGWRVALPGLCFVSPQDLTGALPLPQRRGQDAWGLTPLWDELSASGTRAAAPLAFGSLAEQSGDAHSFFRRMARLLRARADLGLAEGRLTDVGLPQGKGQIYVLSSLPQGGYWLMAANFSRTAQHVTCHLPSSVQVVTATDLENGQAEPVQGRRLDVALRPLQCRHLLLR